MAIKFPFERLEMNFQRLVAYLGAEFYAALAFSLRAVQESTVSSIGDGQPRQKKVSVFTLHQEISDFLTKPYKPQKSVIRSGKGYERRALLMSRYEPTPNFEIITKFHNRYNLP